MFLHALWCHPFLTLFSCKRVLDKEFPQCERLDMKLRKMDLVRPNDEHCELDSSEPCTALSCYVFLCCYVVSLLLTTLLTHAAGLHRDAAARSFE